MGGASEQVTGGVVTRTAGGTGGVPGRADPRFVGVEESAMAGSELGQGGAVGAGKGQLFPLDRGRGGDWRTGFGASWLMAACTAEVCRLEREVL